MSLFDHAFVLLFAVVYPAIGYFGYQKLLRRIAAGEVIPRPSLYATTIVGHWILFAIGIGIWAWKSRPWAAMGWTLTPDLTFVLASLATAAAIALLAWQIRHLIAGGRSEAVTLVEKIGDTTLPVLPHTRKDLRVFNGLSVTAGVVEECLWRGYLFWYLGHFMPLWAAALVSSIGFGIAHAYQGAANVPRIIAVGSVFALLYLLTGSLWLPIILHAAVDILQGRLLFEAISRSGKGDNDDSSETPTMDNLDGAAGA